MVGEGGRDVRQDRPRLRDELGRLVPLSAMKGADSVGRGPDHLPRAGDSLLTGRESGVENDSGVVGEIGTHRLLGDDFDLRLVPLGGTLGDMGDLEPPLALLLHLSQGRHVESDQ